MVADAAFDFEGDTFSVMRAAFHLALVLCVVAASACGGGTPAPARPAAPAPSAPAPSAPAPSAPGPAPSASSATLSKQAIDSRIDDAYPDFLLCRDRLPDALRPGTLKLDFAIEPDGSVDHVKVSSDEYGRGVRLCAADTCRELHFPPHEGASIHVVHRVRFSPS